MDRSEKGGEAGSPALAGAGQALPNALTQAYEGLETAERLREEYVFVPAKVKEVYLAHLLETAREEHAVRSAIVFCATCRRACRPRLARIHL